MQIRKLQPNILLRVRNLFSPHAEGILKFVNQFGLNKEKVLMSGDSVGDVKASREAGVKIASVLWDSHREEIVKTMKSDFYFHSVEELREFLLRIE